MDKTLVRTPAALAATGLSRTSLWRLKLQPPIKITVHGQLVLWHLPLLLKWLQLSGDRDAQDRLIANHLAELISNQPTTFMGKN